MENKQKNDFDMAFEKRKIRNKKNRKQRSLEMLLALVLLWAFLATLGCVFLVFFEGKFGNASDELPQETAEILTTTDQEQLIITTKEETKEEFLLELKEKMLTGNGAVAMLREFFPEDIIYLYGGIYQFFPISDSLKKHSYFDFTILEDEETKQREAYDGTNLVSRFGIDVSYYNGVIDWEMVQKSEVDFSFIRLGFRGYNPGGIFLDTQYINNITGVNQVGMDTGVYFLTQALTEEEAIEEADFVLENIKDYEITFPIVLDIEKNNASDVRTENLTKEEWTNNCIAFCERIKAAGYEPMIYGNIITFTQMLDLNRLEEYKKWWAFSDEEIYYPYDFDIWQYSEEGKINGIDENVDYNIMFEKEKISTLNE